jgi:hypothetical protein
LGNIVNAVSKNSDLLCTGRQPIALNDYSSELSNYLCSPYFDLPRVGDKPVVSISSLKTIEVSNPNAFADALTQKGAKSLIIDPYLLSKFPSLESCDAIRRALDARGWRLLSYQGRPNGSCIASFVQQ